MKSKSSTSSNASKPTTLQQSFAPFFENLLTYKEAAQYLKLSETYLRQLKREGRIPYVSIGNRNIRFRIRSLNQWVEEREVRK